MRNVIRRAVVVLTLAVVGAAQVHAVEKCKVKVDKATGHLLVDATGVESGPVWGASPTAVNVSFPDLSCFDAEGMKLKKCLLGLPDTLAAQTAPEGCTLYIGDSGSNVCKAFIKGCTLGARLRDASFTDVNDPRGLFLANQASGLDAETAARIAAINAEAAARTAAIAAEATARNAAITAATSSMSNRPLMATCTNNGQCGIFSGSVLTCQSGLCLTSGTGRPSGANCTLGSQCLSTVCVSAGYCQ